MDNKTFFAVVHVNFEKRQKFSHEFH